jgi:hypothetical protein
MKVAAVLPSRVGLTSLALDGVLVFVELARQRDRLQFVMAFSMINCA